MSWVIMIMVFWFGVLTSISPCPLASNIAAIAFIGRKTGEKSHILSSGLLYSVGRILTYMVLGGIITTGVLGTATISLFLQKYMNEALGPIMIFLGLILLGWLNSGVSFSLNSEKLQAKAANGSIFWALPIGILFALSFCPVSAGLFFGGLLPFALRYNSNFILPTLFGLGTALPVVAFAFIMAFASAYVGKSFNKLTQVELWVRRVVGATFIIVGIYYCTVHIYALNLWRNI